MSLPGSDLRIQRTAALKRDARAALNEARAAAGLPPKPQPLPRLRKLESSDPRVIAIKQRLGLKGVANVTAIARAEKR